jgi:pentatricopeptide repeat protein
MMALVVLLIVESNLHGLADTFPEKYKTIESLISSNRFEEADSQCRDLIMENNEYPNLVYVKILQGNSFAKSGRLGEAKTVFDELVQRGGIISYVFKNTPYNINPGSKEYYLFWLDLFKQATDSDIDPENREVTFIELVTGLKWKHYIQIFAMSVMLTFVIDRKSKT